MTDSHVAFSCVSLTDKHASKIECMDVWKDYLVVGCQEGTVLIWEVRQDLIAGKRAYSMNMKVSQRNFSKKPITQIAAIEELNVLVSLSDGIVSLHTLPDLVLISQLAKTRGTFLFSVDTSKAPVRLCAAQKRKLLLMEWSGSDFIETKELQVPDMIRTVSWSGRSLCVGFKSEYNLIDIASGTMKDIFPTGKSAIPISNVLPGEQLLLSRDNMSIFLGFDGKPTRKWGITWGEPPLAVGYSFPYVIAILNKAVEIRLVFGQQTLVQSLQISGSKLIATSQSKNKRIGGQVYVANKQQIWALSPIALGSQVEQLLKEGDYEEALSLCAHLDVTDLPDKEEKIWQIKELYAYSLFNSGQYIRAMDMFLELNIDAIQVIGLFPDMLPAQVQDNLRYPFPPAASPLAGAALTKALAALIQYLVRKRGQVMPRPGANNNNNNNNQPEVRKSDLTDSSTNVKTSQQQGAETDNTLDTTKEWGPSTDIATIVDTCLLKSYIRTGNNLVSSLLRVHNCCHVGECASVLIGERKHAELVLLYRGKQMHEQALKVLQKIGMDPPEKTGLTNPLSGPNSSVEYLKHLGKEHLSLVLQFSKWILLKHPDNGIQIFTVADRDERDIYPHDVILQHLKTLDPDNVELTRKLVVEYLEYIILDRGDTTADFHNELLYFYFDIVLALKKDRPDRAKVIVAGSEGGELGRMRTKLVEFLEQSDNYNPEKMLSRYNSNFAPEGLYEEKAVLLSKTGQHSLALREYTHRLRDLAQAERYCSKHFDRDSEKGRDVFLQLLTVLLAPDSPDPDGFRAFAFEILHRHFNELDVPAALGLLPPGTRMGKLYPFFLNVWRSKNKTKRDCQVVVNITKSEMMKVKAELYKLRARHITITDETKCDVCGKSIGDAVFAFYPSGDVVHYRCHNKQKAAAAAAANGGGAPLGDRFGGGGNNSTSNVGGAMSSSGANNSSYGSYGSYGAGGSFAGYGGQQVRSRYGD